MELSQTYSSQTVGNAANDYLCLVPIEGSMNGRMKNEFREKNCGSNEEACILGSRAALWRTKECHYVKPFTLNLGLKTVFKASLIIRSSQDPNTLKESVTL